MLKFLGFCKQHPITVLLVAVVAASFFYQASFRNKHFQECDSALPFELMAHYPASTWAMVENFNLPGKILSPVKAQKLLNTKIGSAIGNWLWPGQPQASKAAKLSAFNPVYAWHNLVFGRIARLKLPYWLQSGFAMGFGSTYPFAQGVFYSLVNSPVAAYEAFMSHGLILTLLLFHLPVLFIFFVALALGIEELPAALASLWMLFAISQYEQGFGLGSTVWYIFSASVWLYVCFKYYNRPKFLTIISIATAVLAWFNYLIVVYWLALMLAEGFKHLKRPINYKGLLTLAWSQWLAIVMIFASTALFFQPGQGKRGNIMLASLGQDIYYIVGNFFTWYEHVAWLAFLQFALGLVVILIFFYQLYKPSFGENLQLKFFRRLSLGFIVALLFFRLTNMLGFAPNRQVLFISPMIFLAAALALQIILKKIPLFNKPAAALVLVFILSGLGFLSVHARRTDDVDQTAQIAVGSEVKAVVVRDCSYNLIYKTYNRSVPTGFLEDAKLEPGKTYLYLSQTNPFVAAINSYGKAHNLTYQILNQSTKETGSYFLAFTPGMSRFPWTRPNNLYLAEFKVLTKDQ